MKTEVSTAANFISRLLKTTGLLSEEQLQHFSYSLEKSLGEHYKHHWFPNAPCRGSAYRCIRINENHKMDPVIGEAAGTIGLTREQLFTLLPSELTMWVDPYEVSYRIGEDGSICVLYESEPSSSSTQPETASIQSQGDSNNRASSGSCKGELRVGMGRSKKPKSFTTIRISSS
ncbi:protein BTG1 [Oncorhynchus tshawytscha]|nr:protein BTG1 [Oncorhynchus kisutch]XP_020339612.1 protein BTG1 [Oncorhynchus kisutch]XP_024259302.1 protein BTG1 [Oncorhynchus tshawytscha]XP_024259303.1 protein BTG1 [Oncorhynchus tshawytscha]XP_031681672.1 protein BTG1 [Oncorhynchus kisutch]